MKKQNKLNLEGWSYSDIVNGCVLSGRLYEFDKKSATGLNGFKKNVVEELKRREKESDKSIDEIKKEFFSKFNNVDFLNECGGYDFSIQIACKKIFKFFKPYLRNENSNLLEGENGK